MIKQVTFLFKMVLFISVIGLFACSEDVPSAPQSNVVKKKIVVSSESTDSDAPAANDPETTDQPTEKAIDQSSLPTPIETSDVIVNVPADELPQGPDNSETLEVSPDALAMKAGGDLVKESLQIADTYNPQGRFDPFEPLFKEQTTADIVSTSKDKRQKRVPQTPLEKVALSQLKLTAIIRAPSGNRALVADASGKGYVIESGTYIGLNSGKVMQIERDRIVIEEEIEDLMGELIVQNSELKLQKPAGEF